VLPELKVELAEDSSELPELDCELVEDEAPAVGASPPPSTPQASGEPSTRLILHALTQLFIEKGIMTREELQQRVRALSCADEGDREET
jgi:hypothetical protein